MGFLALRFAQQGAIATGIDISAEQIAQARDQASSIVVAASFHVRPAEDTGLPPASFDVITASQSWLYFDKAKATTEVKRLLTPKGLLMTSSFGWLPRLDPIAKASEELVLQHNPKWTAGNEEFEVPRMPSWAIDDFRFHAVFAFDEPIPFTWESWRGRFRACRAIGATLESTAVEAFDREHDALLRRITPEKFFVLHRISAHLMEPIR